MGRRTLLLALMAGERLIEIALSARNGRRTLAAGGREHAKGHFVAMVATHAAFLASCALERRHGRAAKVMGLAGLVLAQGLRWWAITSLGERWNIRVITLPSAPPVVRGPYRWMRHPNYVGVAIETLALPAALGAWRTAVAFAPLHAVMLASRIMIEERALGASYRAAFAETPRFLPNGHASATAS